MRSHESSSAVLERLSRVDTSSLVDAGGDLRVLPATLRPIRRGRGLVGRALTVDARGDLMSVLAGLRQAGPGDVLVVAGDDRHAVAGELFATEALRRGVTGIVIDGRCRDSGTLAEIDLPIYARGFAPTACPARAVPVIQVPILIGEVEVRPGDLVRGDDDGIVVATEDEVTSVLDAAEVIQRHDATLRSAIAAGSASLFDGLNYDEHLAALRAGRESRLTGS
jgi:4-hydroxy-4-methyl-2-oxoglutarate aldolase